MRKLPRVVLCLCVFAAVSGCQNHTNPAASVAASAPASPVYAAPPTVAVGMSVDRAYAAIPHRRTVWLASDSTATPEENTYLNATFQLVDQAIAARVAGFQSYSRGDFDSLDIDAQFGQLVNYARAATPPKSLAAYHQDILSALSGERQFFQDWKANRGQFVYAEHIENHPAVRAASDASRAAYSELMRLFPREQQNNKDAFFDYHCALDFL